MLTSCNRLVLALLLAILTGLEPRVARAYQTENVFLVIIDGLRYEESFGDSTHQYVPHLWNDLRPLGTVYSQFYNTGQTSTVSGYSTIGSGKRQGYIVSPFRASEEPMFFEEWRKQTGAPQDKAWVLANYAMRLGGEDAVYSEHPAFGPSFAASARFTHSERDQDVARDLEDVLDTYQPTLAVVWFKAVDINAHLGDRDAYTQAIQEADDLVYQLWQRIDSDADYRDRTTMIVTSDHGRHDDDHGGFQHHGDSCRGCRQVSFLAIGPDIRADTTVIERRSLIDIAPTIAELLGFSMPMSEGRALEEMLISATPPPAAPWRPDSDIGRADNAARFTASPRMSRDPSVAALNGVFHLTWMERDTLSNGEAWGVWHTTTLDSTGPTPLFTGTPDLQTPIGTVIAGEESTGVIAATIYRNWLANDPGDSTFKWGISARHGAVDGPWSEIQVVAPAEFTAFPNGISLSLTGGRGSVAAQENQGARLLVAEQDGSGSWEWATYRTRAGFGETYEYPSLRTRADVKHMAWIAFQREFPRSSWFLPAYMRLDASGARFTELAPSSSDARRHMTLDSDGPLVVACWSRYLAGHWEIYWNRSLDGGLTWEDPGVPLSSSGAGAWRPSVVIGGQRVLIVWEDYRDGNAEIYYRSSSDGGDTWGPDRRLSNATGYSIRPRVALSDGMAYCVWQDDRDGGWEIYGAPVPLSED